MREDAGPLSVTLAPHASTGADVRRTPEGLWRLNMAPGPGGAYRLAQLDDYGTLPRAALPWRPPLRLRLRARASARQVQGTWGWGFWNDPFSASIGVSGAGRRLPAAPTCAWFFYASPESHLALRDTHPAAGFLAATFAGPTARLPLLAAGTLLAPAYLLRPAGRLLRRLAARAVQDDAALVDVDPTDWHDYALEWHEAEVRFAVDGTEVFATGVAPHGPAGLVLWVDNQFAALTPAGRLRFGTLPTREPVWLELGDIRLERP